jgi:hypothetical protein
MDDRLKEVLELLAKKAEAGEFTEAESLKLLREINISYEVLNKFLEEIRIEQLKAKLK